MKKDQIIYWTATGIVAAIMLWSALNFSLNREMEGAFAHLGLTYWFRVELTVAKILGALVLLIPTMPNRMKEFAYGGFAITLIFEIIAHSSSGFGLASLDPLVFLGVLIVSYWSYHKGRDRHPNVIHLHRPARTLLTARILPARILTIRYS